MTQLVAESVLITGARGNIGRKVVEHLVRQGRRRIIQLDRVPDPTGDMLEADLSGMDEEWTKCFRGVDTVVHLAANPNNKADWTELFADNIDATINVFEAARAGGVRRVVFASSLHAALGHEGIADRISVGLSANPANHYGASKAIGERLGRHFAVQHGLSVICLRIGWVQAKENTPPSRHRPLSLQYRWLSNADLCQAVTRAIDVEAVDYAIVNITSQVAGSPWTLQEAGDILGYIPSGVHVPSLPTMLERMRHRVWRRTKGRRSRQRY